MTYLLRAAKCNHVEAAFRYATYLHNTNSLSQAAIWYQHVRPLVKGHSNEAVLSGRAYRGLGEVANARESWRRAMLYFHQGALLADAECQYYVGLYLYTCRILPRDVQAAYQWYRRATAAGSRDAASALGLPFFPSPPFQFLSAVHSLLF